MTDIPVPMPRFDSLATAEWRCVGLATDRGPWPLCVYCKRRDTAAGIYVAPAAVIGAGGAECVNRLVG